MDRLPHEIKLVILEACLELDRDTRDTVKHPYLGILGFLSFSQVNRDIRGVFLFHRNALLFRLIDIWLREPNRIRTLRVLAQLPQGPQTTGQIDPSERKKRKETTRKTLHDAYMQTKTPCEQELGRMLAVLLPIAAMADSLSLHDNLKTPILQEEWKYRLRERSKNLGFPNNTIALPSFEELSAHFIFEHSMMQGFTNLDIKDGPSYGHSWEKPWFRVDLMKSVVGCMVKRVREAIKDNTSASDSIEKCLEVVYGIGMPTFMRKRKLEWRSNSGNPEGKMIGLVRELARHFSKYAPPSTVKSFVMCRTQEEGHRAIRKHFVEDIIVPYARKQFISDRHRSSSHQRD